MNSSLTHTFEHENTAIGGYNVDNSSKYKKVALLKLPSPNQHDSHSK